jgi:hypothetical protein
MIQTHYPTLGRRRSKNAERAAEIMRQHFASQPAAKPAPVKGECPACKRTFKRLDKHRCKG